ncbi:hypothetical protein ID866_7682 [Astraeus odoratus]|nr:hypothetical protein ID866_7682 [Astraeus odoratus]
MGIFKKFFSIGSKKSKKRLAANNIVPPVPSTPKNLKVLQEDEAEAAVSRLLRSSSARFAVESEVDLLSLPPLPHPIDTVIPPAAASTGTIASISQRSTYSVTVHGRRVHSRTEFPNAYPPLDKTFTPKKLLTDSARRRSKSVPITPRDQGRLLKLRQDPSVVNLLNHYDEEGCLDSRIFSNTPPSPPKEGRVQRRRTGSTLRQLLGHPSSPELRDTSDGDISWAEKFLGETDGNSSASSSGLPTPADTHFTDVRLAQVDHSIALSTECDSAANHRTFSSLEVELSISTDQNHHPVHDHTMTPQKASEIFGFLTERRESQEVRLPSRLPQPKPTPSRFSPEPQQVDIHGNVNIPRRSSTHIPQSVSPPTHRRSSTISYQVKTGRALPAVPIQQRRQDDVNRNVRPPSVIALQHTGQSARGPRGPRAPSHVPPRAANGTSNEATSHDAPAQMGNVLVQTGAKCAAATRMALGEKSNTNTIYPSPACTPAAKSHIPKLRSASGSTLKSVDSITKESEAPKVVHGSSHAKPAALAQPQLECISSLAGAAMSNENENKGTSRLPQPVTPARPLSFRPPYITEPPSPASSSELSPVAKQLMMNLRQQRMHARQKDRQVGRLGSGQSRIRY